MRIVNGGFLRVAVPTWGHSPLFDYYYYQGWMIFDIRPYVQDMWDI